MKHTVVLAAAGVLASALLGGCVAYGPDAYAPAPAYGAYGAYADHL